MIRPDANVEADLYWEMMDRKQELWLSHRPVCMVCEENIGADYCYIVYDDEPDQTCICESCMEGQIEKLRKSNVNQGLRDALEEYIQTMWGMTPEGRGY